MTDFFALLDEPRRPWIDPEALKRRFLALSASAHPDRAHNLDESKKTVAAQSYAQLNSAYNCLRDPKERLAHLLELERGTKPKDLQTMPADLAERFLEVAQLCRQADAFLAEKARVTSPLLQVQLFERGQDWVQKLNELQGRLTPHHEDLTGRLRALDAEWDTARTNSAARSESLRRLEELHRLLSFSGRWTAQIQERLVQLAV
jgi:DnaJ-domain-containing protein 1